MVSPLEFPHQEIVIGNNSSTKKENIHGGGGFKRLRELIGEEKFNEFAGTDDGKVWIEKVADNKRLMDAMENDPSLLNQLNGCSYEIFNDTKLLENAIFNAQLRSSAYAQIKEDIRKRLEQNPIASEEELLAGVYWEMLEPQVREAIRILRGKGYSTFESGFDQIPLGRQYIGFQKGTRLEISEAMKQDLQEAEIDLDLISLEDREQITLTPRKPLGLDEWKIIWNHIAAGLVDTGKPAEASPVTFRDLFLQKQEKIKHGESTFVGGFIVEKGGVREVD